MISRTLTDSSCTNVATRPGCKRNKKIKIKIRSKSG